jgi:hypothetical protein
MPSPSGSPRMARVRFSAATSRHEPPRAATSRHEPPQQARAHARRPQGSEFNRALGDIDPHRVVEKGGRHDCGEEQYHSHEHVIEGERLGHSRWGRLEVGLHVAQSLERLELMRAGIGNVREVASPARPDRGGPPAAATDPRGPGDAGHCEEKCPGQEPDAGGGMPAEEAPVPGDCAVGPHVAGGGVHCSGFPVYRGRQPPFRTGHDGQIERIAVIEFPHCWQAPFDHALSDHQGVERFVGSRYEAVLSGSLIQRPHDFLLMRRRIAKVLHRIMKKTRCSCRSLHLAADIGPPIQPSSAQHNSTSKECK